ncbi:potassium channel subfamily U member 1 [Zootoca vivipara]|uniref:potassium channel subfamily U member 1 n=1 Tax=Zootoca vivipara TaxID=8524 RepID=UPI00293BEDCC|nr:potassium channel subfamily U member 1 [Zootoca vivipara]
MYYHEENGSWDEEIGSHCTEYVQLAFMSSCLSIFVGGILLILMVRVIEYTLKSLLKLTGLKTRRMPRLNLWKRHFQVWVVRMISAQTVVGRILVILVFLFSIGSLIIYFINCQSVKQFCLSFEDQTVFVDLFFNLFFLFYFGLRFFAASDKLAFWVELNSIVDFFTITPVCVSFYLGRNWLGLRFLRALRLMELPKILQFLQITTTATAIKLSKLLAVSVSTCLTAAGFLHWIENSGDPWAYNKNPQSLTYFDCLYMIMVTMSTVGYGDVVVKTSLGRSFILFFIIAGLILFANLVPEMVDIVGSTKLHKGSYMVVKGRKFIVVCGNITLNSVTTFLRDFLSPGSGQVETEIVFLGENDPGLELETIFRCYAAYSTFFQGSVMKTEDLQRVKMENADACLILADTCSPNPYIEDTTNIMRVLSIKNHFPNTKVILQIIQSSNKVYLPKLPNWDWRRGDSIICFAELKLGLIAQSCVVPGLTTLLTSLFIREDSKKLMNLNKHLLEIEGQDYKVMTQLLSNDFIDMSFKDVAKLCFLKLDLMLLAIEFRSDMQGNSILINPPSMIKLHFDTMGFFIAKSTVQLNRARFYCRQCHSDIMNPELIVKCRCKTKAMRKASRSPSGFVYLGSTISSKLFIDTELDKHIGKAVTAMARLSKRIQCAPKPSEILEEDPGKTTLDSSGMFHWCEAVPFEKALLKRRKGPFSVLRDHIVVCVFGDATSSLIGLRNFVMPLRASNFTFSELKDIVFLGSLDYLHREWEFIHNFPKLFLLRGSALSCADLKAANIQYCSMCAVLSAHARGPGDQTLVDTKSILATLNIRSLHFKANSSLAELHTGSIAGRSMPILSKRTPIITELKIASNAQLFEQSSTNESVYGMQQLSRGTVFSDSFLDAIMCTTYRNHHVLALLQSLVTGGTSPELEEYLAEEASLSGSTSNMMHFGSRNRCKLALVALTDSPSATDGLLLFFGDIYNLALELLGILCFGLYRQKDENSLIENRCVIARPPTNFEIYASDQFFCLVPFNTLVNDLTAVIKSIRSTVRRKDALVTADHMFLS